MSAKPLIMKEEWLSFEKFDRGPFLTRPADASKKYVGESTLTAVHLVAFLKYLYPMFTRPTGVAFAQDLR